MLPPVFQLKIRGAKKVKLLVTCLLVFAAAATTDAQRRTPQRQTNDTNSIRQIDFRNFTFPLDNYNVNQYGRGRVEVKDGRFVFSDGGSYGPNAFEVKKVIYGDLTGDGREEAAVLAAIGYVESESMQNAPNSYAYIYTHERGRTRLLTIHHAEYVDSDTQKFYRRAVRDDTALYYAAATQIENGLLVVEGVAAEARCCPLYTVRMKLRWNGRRFILAGKPERKRIQQ
jgi:hypothetical protein